MSYQRDFDTKLRIGIVGVGSHAYRNILPTLTFLPVDLVAVCDINRELATKTARQYGAPGVYTRAAEMYASEKLDGVFLCVSPQLHPDLTCEALRAGLHVWLEKPPAMRAAQVQHMLDARGDRVVVVGFKKAFMPATRKVKSILADPKHQPLRTILAEYVVNVPVNGREVLDKNQYTNWLGNGCHPLSLMLEVGGEVESVTTHRSRHGGGCVVLQFRSGAIGTLVLADGSPRQTERYAFYAPGCELTIDNCWRVTCQRGVPFQYGKTTTYVPDGVDHGAIVWEPQNCLATLENKSLFTQGFYDEMRYFCDCVLEKRPAITGSLEFTRHLMQVYEAALLSDGGPVCA